MKECDEQIKLGLETEVIIFSKINEWIFLILFVKQLNSG